MTQQQIEQAAGEIASRNTDKERWPKSFIHLKDILIEMGNLVLSHQWIPVDEELPEENELVIFRNEEDVAVGVYIGGKWFLTWTNGREFPREVTHWMHIPTLEGGEE